MTANTCLTIDLDAIRHNIQSVRQKAGVPVMAVVKANAYGHGAVHVARLLENDCAFFGVSCINEALELRQAGITKPILIFGHTPADAYATAVKENIRPTIYRYEDALALSQAAQELDLPAPFHFAVDTGMSRIGFQATEEDARICAAIAALPGLVAEGLYSHFHSADCGDLTSAQMQKQLFDQFYGMLRELGVQIPIRHLSNSAAVMNFADHYDMVRAGIVTYGLYPSDQVNPALLDLKPALSWHSRVTCVKQLEPGRSVSYGATFVTEKPTIVATVAVGYADGYRRNLSGKFYVLIRGQKAPILGRVCMDQLIVDVTDIPDVRVDDSVTLIGTDGTESITVEQFAAACDSFNYEIVCNIGNRSARTYKNKSDI